ncbi:MAG: pyruvate dehydrogenase (acetyl-transferring) E1 component subunit alpha [Myxococcales bacterium]|nr:pyruvate dehydrogenase (acetyl-transferring) E1 component subunit alpha [Myxococcales bacterium]
MPITDVYSATTRRIEILDKDGKVDEALLPSELDDATLQRALELMMRMRAFDEKALTMQRQGRIGTYGSMRGQEAAQAGLALAIEPDDWLVPSIREQGVLEACGVPMRHWFGFCKGDERMAVFPGVNALTPSIPVGSQLLHAAGIGMALELRGEATAAIGFAGDGATSEGDFHEALNFAGVFNARTLFFIQNNGWAISVPITQQTRSATIAQKAHAYGIEGVQVDGNDVLASYVASRDALRKVRAGEGPVLIEAVTYRMESHTTADDHTRYRSADEVAYWAERDPIKRMRAYLEGRGLWDETRHEATLKKLGDDVEAEVARLEDNAPPPPTDIFDHMYSAMPETLRAQRQALLDEIAVRGGNGANHG